MLRWYLGHDNPFTRREVIQAGEYTSVQQPELGPAIYVGIGYLFAVQRDPL